MPDKKESKSFEPLLHDMAPAKRLFLAQIINMPGFSVLIELLNAGGKEVNDLVIKTNPEDANYSKLLEARAQGARSVSVYVDRVMKSASWHADQVKHAEVQEEKQAEDVVSKTYGINIIKPPAKS